MKTLPGSAAGLSLLLGLTGLTFADEPAKPATDPPTEGTPPAEGTPAEGTPAEGVEAEAKGTTISYTLEVASGTSYVWRGFLISSSRFEPVLQPYGELGIDGVGPGAIAVGLWMNYALTNSGDDSPLELDAYASYTIPIDIVELKLGYIVYLYPDHPDGTDLDQQHEFQVQGTFDFGIPVQPYVSVSVDPFRTKGVYANAGVNHSVTVSSIEIASSLNLGVSKYEGIDFGLQDITLQSRGSYSIGESGLYVALTGGIAYAGRDPGPDAPRILPYALLSVGFSK